MEMNVDNAKQLLAQHEQELQHAQEAQSHTLKQQPITAATSAPNGAATNVASDAAAATAISPAAADETPSVPAATPVAPTS